MKIGIIASELPPQHSGVADYSCQLAMSLSKSGHEVWVFGKQAEVPTEYKLIQIELNWSLNPLRRIQKEVQACGIERILIQYTPQCISPQTLGVSLHFPIWVSALKFWVGIPVGMIFHEVNYPVEFSLRGLLLGVPHVLQFCFLLLSIDYGFFTTWPIRKKIQKIFFWKRSLHWLPVGSNLDQTPLDLEPNWREKNGIGPHQTLLLYFGGLHPTHLIGHLKAVLLALEEKDPSGQVILICIGVRQIERFFSTESESRFLRRIRAFSFLPGFEVRQWFAHADLVLAPFMDGISSRRGSAIAGFQHGRAVLTTEGISSPGPIPWKDFCAVAPVESPEEYASQALELIAHPEDRHRLGQKARIAFENYFSWSHIVNQLLSMIK